MKFIYQPLVNKLIVQSLRPVSKLLPQSMKIPVNGSFNFILPNGKMLKMTANPTNYLAKTLFWNGVESYEYNAISLFSEIAKNSEVFFDIGANVGYYSLVAYGYNPKIKITCFEPVPAIFKFLNYNLKLNGIIATTENLALADKSGTLKFYSVIRENFENLNEQLNGEGTLNEEVVKDRNKSEINVTTTTLDDYFEKNQLHFPDLIKMDTEATEHLILKGASKFLATHKPLIFCEVLPNRFENEIATELKKHGYLFLRIYKDFLKLTSSLINNEDNERDYLFVQQFHFEKINKIRPIV